MAHDVGEADARRWAGLGLFAAGAIFWLVNTSAEAAFPGYDVHEDALSRLGSVGAPTSLAWNAALLVLGTLWLAGAVAAFRPVGRPWLVLNAVPPLCAYLVALFPVGTIAAPHWIGAFGLFVSGGLVAIADSRLVRGPFRVASAATGATGLPCLVVFAVLPPGDLLGFGGAERLVAYPIMIWLMGMGGYLMAGGPLGAAKAAG